MVDELRDVGQKVEAVRVPGSKVQLAHKERDQR